MKNCLKLFLLLCLLLAITTLSAADKPTHYYNQQISKSTEEPFIPFIDLLQDGESYQIEIVSVGCFSGAKQIFAIIRAANAYTLNFEDAVKELGADEINAIRDFELKLQTLAAGGCSTVDTYKLVYGAESVQVSDGTCSFNGGHKLMKQLGLVPGK